MDSEHKEEIMWEEAQEVRDEPVRIWISENKEYCMEEFIRECGHEDAFDEFSREEYKIHNE